MKKVLDEGKLNEKDLVHVFWPVDKCKLLKDNLALVDSPGLNISSNIDDCIDADVFVFVVDAESEMMYYASQLYIL